MTILNENDSCSGVLPGAMAVWAKWKAGDIDAPN
jgi:hypothetical protein